MENNSVDHPDHYKGKSLEAIDIIEDYDLNFCLGNAIKYILRAGKKGERQEDLEKAIWYLQRELNVNTGTTKTSNMAPEAVDRVLA